MPTVKELAESIRTALKETPEVLEKVSPVLSNIESEFETQTARATSLQTEISDTRFSLKKVTEESIDRRKKLADVYADVETKEAKIKSMEDAQAEFDNLKIFKTDYLKQQRSSFIESFGKIKDHENFTKVSKRFKLPDADDDGNYDFSKADGKDLDHNVLVLNDLNDLDYFADGDNHKPDPPPPGAPKGQRGSDATFKERIAQAKTPKEITKIMAEEGGV